jgi:hypothetical protein
MEIFIPNLCWILGFSKILVDLPTPNFALIHFMGAPFFGFISCKTAESVTLFHVLYAQLKMLPFRSH